MSTSLLHLLPLLAGLTWAAVTDIRQRKIRNWLTLSLMIGGMINSLTALRTVTPGASVLGLLTGFGLLLPLFVLRAVGGGDVKLLAGVGAWLGPAGVLLVFCFEAITGMVMVLVQATMQGRLSLLLRNTATVAVNLAHVRQLGVEHVATTGQAARTVSTRLPYAVPVLMAVAFLIIKSHM